MQLCASATSFGTGASGRSIFGPFLAQASGPVPVALLCHSSVVQCAAQAVTPPATGTTGRSSANNHRTKGTGCHRQPTSNGGDGSNEDTWQCRVVSVQPLFTLAAYQEPVVLTLSSFAICKPLYIRLTRSFRERYFEQTGLDVRFRLSFGGSRAQAQAIIDGQRVDVVALALPTEVQAISDAGLLAADWRKRLPNAAVVCESTIGVVVRPDNPKSVNDWEDLARDGVDVVVAHPKTSGVPLWVFLALWAHKRKKGDEVARRFASRVFENVVYHPRHSREAQEVFCRQKVGDVLLTYESELVHGLASDGEKPLALSFTVPKRNVRIECPVAIVDEVVDTKPPVARQCAQDFCKFLFSEAGQTEYAAAGFRISPKVCKKLANQTPPPTNCTLWNVDKELGGWPKVEHNLLRGGAVFDTIHDAVVQTKGDRLKPVPPAKK